MNDNMRAIFSFSIFAGVLLVMTAYVVIVAVEHYSRTHGVIYATWTDRACRHVEPAEYDCDNLPEVIEDIVWVSPEWRP